MKKAPCHFGMCFLCASHCKCQPQEPKVLQTPKPKRCSREETLSRIKEAVVNRTPAAMKSNDSDYWSWKDFYELVPRSQDTLLRLHDTIQVTVTMGRSVWCALISYAVDLVKKLGEVVAQSDQTSKVQEMVLEGIAKRHNPEYMRDTRVRDGAEQSTRTMLISMLAYVRAQKRNDSGSRLIRSFLTQHFTKDQLDYVQDQAGIPQEERVLYGADAWARGRKDYSNMLLSGNSNMVDLKELTSSRVSDQVVMEVVGCVVENCDIKSWGENLVPLGGGESIAMPSLTPKCGLEEMWEQYSQSKDEERVQFISILRRDGPFASGHKNFKGSAYNLLILWADGFTSSWEPLFAL